MGRRHSNTASFEVIGPHVRALIAARANFYKLAMLRRQFSSG